MARRSPLNERYQKNTSPSGKTRKSASSAKIKRPASESKKAERPRIGLVPQTPEMKKWRRIWGALLGIGVLLALSTFLPQVRTNESLVRIIFAVEVAALAVAVGIDWLKIRPLRQQAVEQAKRERKEK